MHPGADEIIFARDVEPPVSGARCQQHGWGTVLLARLGDHRADAAIVAVRVWRLAGVYGGHSLRDEQLDTEAFRLLPHLVGQVGTGDALGKAGVVVDSLR